ncbi:MAG TPA: MlaD family protein [Bryobacteraceae bacterium]|jgi:phospholipid/cholesterol/gamma-HCH transport system substrate-binding protein|nr:MlaD family protein [Bryobacteraceae bacterium]
MPSVQRVRWAKFRVISVAVVAIIILTVLMYLLTGGTLLQPKARLALFINDATGLGQDSPVRVDGIGIGKVDWVGFSGSNDPLRIIRVQMTIERQWLTSITADSIAQISNDTLVGDKFVDITTGKAPEHVLNNGELHFKAQPDIMRSVDLTQFEDQLRTVDATLADIEAGRTPLGQFIVHEDTYITLRRRMTELQSTIQRTAASTGEIGSLVYTDAMFQRIHTPLAQLDQTIEQIQAGQGGLGRFLRDPAQYEKFRSMLQDLRTSISGIRAGAFFKSDDAYRGANTTVASIARQIDIINASHMMNVADAYETWNGAASEMQKSLKDFRENPKKYLRLKVF